MSTCARKPPQYLVAPQLTAAACKLFHGDGCALCAPDVAPRPRPARERHLIVRLAPRGSG